MRTFSCARTNDKKKMRKQKTKVHITKVRKTKEKQRKKTSVHPNDAKRKKGEYN